MTTPEGKVSIITATFNAARFIDQTIMSIVQQTYGNWELLITDDCSTDGTWEILKTWAKKDQRIRIFRLEQNKGAGAARNKSLYEATGRYIAFCDSDDYWTADKLEKQIAFMQQQQCGICYSSYYVVNEVNKITGKVVCPKVITPNDILHDDSMGMLTMVYDTQYGDKQEFPLIRRRQDWAMKILLMRHITEARGISECLAYYRHTSNSLSRNKFALVKYNKAVYRQVLGYSWIATQYHFFLRFLPKYAIKKVKQFIINHS